MVRNLALSADEVKVFIPLNHLSKYIDYRLAIGDLGMAIE